MIRSLLLIALLSFTFAEGKASTVICSPDDMGTDFVDQLALQLEEISWFGASPTQVEKGHCINGPKVDNSFLDRYLLSIEGEIVPKKNILGIEFENESQPMLDLFSKLVDPSTDRFQIFTYKKPQLKSGLVPASCKKVLCAAEAIFGRNQAKRLLYMLDHYGLNGSHLIYTNSSAWKTNELDQILRSVDDIPSFLIKQESNKAFYHFSRGYTRGSDLTLANAVMEFFDRWNTSRPGEQTYVIFHEVAHNLSNIDRQTDLDSTPEWLAFSGWTKKDDKWQAKNLSVIPSEYGRTNPAEDFAESVTAYRYNPNAKKLLGEEKYRFIKETVFLGVEFDKEESCRGDKGFLAQVAPTEKEYNKAHIVKDEDIRSRCSKQLSDALTSFSFSSFDQCYLQSATNDLLQSKINKLDLKYSQYTKKRMDVMKLPVPKNVNTQELNKFKERLIGIYASALSIAHRDPLRFIDSKRDALLKKSPEELCQNWSKGIGQRMYYEKKDELSALLDDGARYDTYQQFENVAYRACVNLRNAGANFSEKNFAHTLTLVLNGK